VGKRGPEAHSCRGRKDARHGHDRSPHDDLWLATTLDENRVHKAARATVVAFQAEAADALDAYFHDGGDQSVRH